ncbi:hypothetical protein [Zhihengliuella flava]|uniref:Nicotinamide mononucleotide transporter n=1 Tax=Zhihengliuella flava TaxID=1285193 RepID=A0A931DC23_9MICC|nr:hypothetical protein [Zhihengliuella flava]MBG6084113.1 hypothetical protein [Zhihengliuella flava]
MDQLFSTLFNQPFGTDTGLQVALSAVSTLLTAIALMVLAHRNDLGWWFQILAVFAGPLVLALTFGYEGLFYAVPALGIAAYGLWRYSAFDLRGKFTRLVPPAGFSIGQLAWGVALVALLTAAQWGPFLFTSAIIDAPMTWLQFGALAVTTASFVGIAQGVRWAWLASAAGTAAYLGWLLTFAPGFGSLLVLVLQFLAALYGFVLAGASRRGPEVDDAQQGAAYPPSPYAG